MPDFNFLVQLLIDYRYLVLFPAVIIEGPIVTAVTGFLVTLNYFSFFSALLVIVVADICSDSLYYGLGRWGRQYPFLRMLKVPDETVDRFEEYIQFRLFQTILLSKVLHGFGAGILVAAGSARAPFFRFMLYNLIITIVKSATLLLVGYFFGKWLVQLNSLLDIFGFVAFLILVGVVFLVMRNKKKDILA